MTGRWPQWRLRLLLPTFLREWWGIFLGVKMRRRVAVFIDYQIIVQTAREAFPLASAARPWTNIDPLALVSCALNLIPKYDGVWLEPGGRRPS